MDVISIVDEIMDIFVDLLHDYNVSNIANVTCVGTVTHCLIYL